MQNCLCEVVSASLQLDFKTGTEDPGGDIHTYLDAEFSRASEEDEAAFGEVLNLKKM